MTLNFVDLLTPFFVDVWGSVLWILLLVGLDFILGVIIALMNKDFQFNKLAQFLETGVLLKLVGYVVVALVFYIGQHLPGAFIPDDIMGYTSDVVFAILVVDLSLGSILPHLAELGIFPEAASVYIQHVGRGE